MFELTKDTIPWIFITVICIAVTFIIGEGCQRYEVYTQESYTHNFNACIDMCATRGVAINNPLDTHLPCLCR